MTPTPDLPTPERDALILSCPDTTVSALPYLIGFTPVDSVVILWVTGGRIALTQRIDVPPPAHIEAFLAAVWAHSAADDVDELIVVLVCERKRAEDLAEAIAHSAWERQTRITDVLHLSGDTWRSLMCGDEECCPPDGRTVPSEIRHLISAEFAFRGAAPLPTRADLVAEVASRPVKAAALTSLTRQASALAATQDREVWRDAAADRTTALLVSDADVPVDEGAVIDLLVGLADVRVRDTTLWECARLDSPGLARAHGRLAKATAWAPAGHVAPVATCCAVLAWLQGDGARALIALDRALEDDPEYSLAILVMTAVRGGLPPTAWREAMSGLTRDECRVPRHAA